MKTILALLVTVSAFSAHALESHYGKASKVGNTVRCSLVNRTENTLDAKYVVFSITTLGRHGIDGQIQARIDQRARTGETLVAKVSAPQAHTVQNCRFVVR